MAANLKEMKEKLAFSCNILANEGHWDNILGHVSVRIPGQNKILMKPHSFGFEEIRPQHIIVVDIGTGKKLEGKYERHSEVFIHTEIMKTRPDVNCVVHSHPPYATAFGALGQRLRPISHEGNIFFEGLHVRLHHRADSHSRIRCRSRQEPGQMPRLADEKSRLDGRRRIDRGRDALRDIPGKGRAHSTTGDRVRRPLVDERRGGRSQIRTNLYAAPPGIHVGVLRPPRQKISQIRVAAEASTVRL